MAKRSSSPLRKPTLDTVRAFAEGKSTDPTPRSGLIPVGDVRLTANISAAHHLKLRIRAAETRTTVGEMIEAWIDSWEPRSASVPPKPRR